jgi:hypothetical protein
MTQFSNTYTITTNGLTTGTLHKTADPKPPPTDLITTRTQQTIDGWIGQILVAGRVVYETEPWPEAEDAIGAANERMLGRIADLFRDND